MYEFGIDTGALAWVSYPSTDPPGCCGYATAVSYIPRGVELEFYCPALYPRLTSSGNHAILQL